VAGSKIFDAGIHNILLLLKISGCYPEMYTVNPGRVENTKEGRKESIKLPISDAQVRERERLIYINIFDL